MAFKTDIVVSLLVLLTVVTIVRGLKSCTCASGFSPGWDCAFRQRRVILKEEYCSKAAAWRFNSNSLQDIPFLDYISGNDVYISNNELGFGDVSTLRYLAPNLLDVSDNYLESLAFLQTSVSTLIASGNAISEIPWYATKVLILARNNITRIPNNSFQSTLTYLDLSGNPLSSVPEEAFNNLGSLGILLLNGTQLSTLTNGTFTKPKSLTYLSLKNNELINLPEDIFITLQSLQELDLQLNKLGELPLGIFKNLHNLRSLNLDNNLLAALPEELFSRMHSLEDLSVRRNRLTTVPSLRLCNGPLETVLFSDNYITQLDEAAVRALLRPGFIYGDLTNNLLEAESSLWVNTATDVEFTVSYDDCTTLGLTVENHGSVIFCIPGQFTASSG